ncbi:phage tail sheath family protein [Streptomyces sp. NPDC005551]|uniref:phage tail sheath family protein n=1 Tax=Streptomyces sp. NPDC005551 TaxID=3364725 RepID=UPI0036CD4818
MATTTTGRPGVFVSESLNALTSVVATQETAVAAFVGTHDSGPVGPVKINSWSAWKALYGGFGNGSKYLPYAVYEYFNSGGGTAWIVRAVASDAVNASLVLSDLGTGGSGGTDPQPVLTLKAVAPGVTGNSLYIDIVGGSGTTGRFSLTVRSGSPTSAPVERYVDVSLDPADARNVVAMIGAAKSGSQYLTAEYNGDLDWDYRFTPATQSGTPLTGGLDGTDDVDLVSATQLLNGVNGILNINLPGVSDATVINPLITWAEASGDRFLVVDGPAAKPVYADTLADYTNLSPLGASTTTPFTKSSYLAVYGPWLNFSNPSSSVAGATRPLPPGGAMLGLYAQADRNKGPQQPPAGTEFPVVGAVSAQVAFANSDLDTLNELGVNVIRSVPGSNGLIPMGARTFSNGMPDRYISIRRTLMQVRRLCIQRTSFAVFRPNNEDLWDQISSILTDELSTLQQSGVLRGATAADAFFVRCDETNNNENSVANGIVNIEVGVALNTPAEFIVIQIGQMASGATSDDTLAS